MYLEPPGYKAGVPRNESWRSGCFLFFIWHFLYGCRFIRTEKLRLTCEWNNPEILRAVTVLLEPISVWKFVQLLVFLMLAVSLPSVCSLVVKSGLKYPDWSVSWQACLKYHPSADSLERCVAFFEGFVLMTASTFTGTQKCRRTLSRAPGGVASGRIFAPEHHYDFMCQTTLSKCINPVELSCKYRPNDLNVDSILHEEWNKNRELWNFCPDICA